MPHLCAQVARQEAAGMSVEMDELRMIQARLEKHNRFLAEEAQTLRKEASTKTHHTTSATGGAGRAGAAGACDALG